MTTNARIIAASTQDVWAVLADGWLYPLWVVGASRVRAVDASWPAVGSRIHHSFGVWPAVIDDHTEVLESQTGASLRLKARAWPAGEAAVVLSLVPTASGTRVTIEEDAVSGPGTLVPSPVRDATLSWRNAETLRRLALVVEGRGGG